MPKNKDATSRYKIIDTELRRGRPLKSSELAEKCSDALGIRISIRTIQKDIEELKEDTALGYYAQIKYDKNKKAHYYSSDAPKIFTSVELSEAEIYALLFYAKSLSHYKYYTIFDNIFQAIEKVLDGSNIPLNIRETFKSRSLYEAEKNLPIKGNEYIKEIIIALIEGKKIEFDYARFDGITTHRSMIPFLLKEDKHMLYVIGQLTGKESPTTFALDRMKNLIITNEFFKHIEFNSEEYFKYSFGITVQEGNPIKITLSFNPSQGNYIKTLPIHETQQIIVDSDKELKITIRVRPSYEFYSKILSYGPDVKIISPKKIANKLKTFLEDALKAYKN